VEGASHGPEQSDSSCGHQEHDQGLCSRLKAATMDIFGRTGFAQDFGAVQSLIDGEIPFGITELELALKEHARRIVSPNPLLKYYWLPTTANRTFKAHQRKVRELIGGIVEARLKQQEEHPDSRPHEDLLQFMLEAAREDTTGLITQESLTDSLITVLVAGFDTTSLGLAAAVYLLSQHDDKLARLHDELARELPTAVPSVDADTIARLRYTKAVFEEAMRLFPPVPITVRTTTSDVTLSTGAVIPTDTMVWLPMHLTHRNPEHWHDPGTVNSLQA
jgi:cytochrome P450